MSRMTRSVIVAILQSLSIVTSKLKLIDSVPPGKRIYGIVAVTTIVYRPGSSLLHEKTLKVLVEGSNGIAVGSLIGVPSRAYETE